MSGDVLGFAILTPNSCTVCLPDVFDSKMTPDGSLEDGPSFEDLKRRWALRDHDDGLELNPVDLVLDDQAWIKRGTMASRL
jgi:hypothetical protein